MDSLQRYEMFLANRGITLKENRITKRIDLITEYPNPAGIDYGGRYHRFYPYQSLEWDDFLRDEYSAETGENPSVETLEGYTWDIAGRNPYNPVAEYLQKAADGWDGNSRFPELFGIMGVRDNFSKKLIKDWFVECAALGRNPDGGGFGGRGLMPLVLRTVKRPGLIMDPSNLFFEAITPNSLSWYEEIWSDDSPKDTDYSGAAETNWIVKIDSVKWCLESFGAGPDFLLNSRGGNCGLGVVTDEDKPLNHDTGYFDWRVVDVYDSMEIEKINGAMLDALWGETEAALRDNGGYRPPVWTTVRDMVRRNARLYYSE